SSSLITEIQRTTMFFVDTAGLALTIYLTFLTTGVSVLFWGRMHRIERRMDSLEIAMREGFKESREEMRAGFAKNDSEIAIMRSDLTHVALAVGAKPRASGD
ncbi:MAG TPA: hypothetical protein VG408_04625, partial [Actinomycetota bacterium]|nr:hypothetical protein [Actinomycetota bacterium]